MSTQGFLNLQIACVPRVRVLKPYAQNHQGGTENLIWTGCCFAR